jgi:hypothetical protein
MTTEFRADVTPDDADTLELCLQQLALRDLNAERAAADPPRPPIPNYAALRAPLDYDHPGIPGGFVNIERASTLHVHKTIPNLRALTIRGKHHDRLFDGQTVAYLNQWGEENERPGLGGWAQSQRAQLIGTLPAEYRVDPEPLTSSAKPEIRKP